MSRERIRQVLVGTRQRATSQRALLLDLLREEGGHRGADELYHRAREKTHKLSLSTVYRTMRLFKKLGLVEELHFEEEHHHYERKAPREHHHLVCLKCGRITEFASPYIERLKDEIGRQHQFKVSSGEVHFSGYCASCPDPSP